MNKTAIKNFAIQAREKLIAEIKYKAGLLGITETGIRNALPQSGNGTEYYDIGAREPYAISGVEVRQRRDLAAAIEAKQAESDYLSAYGQVMDEVAYTWFNRLIAVRFMEVNDYLPSRIRVLSSESGKLEPDIVTSPFDAQIDYTDAEKEQIIGWKNGEELDEAFRFLFLKQCNELNAVLPALFEKVSDYTELLLAVSFTDKDGVVYHLVHDIPEEDFHVETGGQVEIIGWLYQYYNTEPKAKVFARASGTKIKKEEIPAATQLFTPDWIVRYMVENSLGRLWVEGHPETRAQMLPTKEEQEAYVGKERSPDDHKWHYYLEEAEQEPEVQAQLAEIRKEYAVLGPENLLCMDPCMGSGHILCYFFDVLMQIYESQGYGRRDAAQSILEHNIWGLDIDDRTYQLAYFAVMMKARQYDRRILSRGIQPHVYAIVESNGFNKTQLKYFGAGMDETERNDALNQVNGLLEQLHDAKEYGSILTVDQMNWGLLREFAANVFIPGQMEMDAIGIEKTQEGLKKLIDVGEALAQKYQVVVTNPPYMVLSGASSKLVEFTRKRYTDTKYDFFAVFIERVMKFSARNAIFSMITQQAWMFQPTFTKLREKLCISTSVNMLHLGARAFDEISGEVVQTTAFTYINTFIDHYKSLFLRLVTEIGEKNKENAFFLKSNRYYCEVERLSNIPNMPIAYWISQNFSKIFKNTRISEFSISDGQTKTGNNDKYMRFLWEVDRQKIGVGRKWALIAKGGSYRKWAGNIDMVIDWSDSARTHYRKDHVARIAPEYIWFRKGVCWNHISSTAFAARYLREDCLFETAAPAIFFDSENRLFYIIGYLNSSISNEILAFINPTLSTNVGDITIQPIIENDQYVETVVNLVRKNIDISECEWNFFETAFDFRRHPLLRSITTVEEAYVAWADDCENRFNQLKVNEEELNRIFINIYGLQDELTPEVKDRDVTIRKADLQRDIKSLISYAVGCMFGRYSLDEAGLVYAGGEWDDSKYNTFIPVKDNVLPITDEEYFDDDIVGLFCGWLKKVYGEDTLKENLDFIAKALNNKGNSSREVIRNYFLNSFFKDHCSTYSVTGSGKRPIYWLYDSGKQNGFKALVYMHRYNVDTTGRVRADYLHHIEKIYGSEIERMEETIQNSKNNREVAAATKRREKLQKQLKECQEYDEKIAHLALARMEIDLDDGVKVNYRKIQTDRSGRLYEILADSKTIMIKEK